MLRSAKRARLEARTASPQLLLRQKSWARAASTITRQASEARQLRRRAIAGPAEYGLQRSVPPIRRDYQSCALV